MTLRGTLQANRHGEKSFTVSKTIRFGGDSVRTQADSRLTALRYLVVRGNATDTQNVDIRIRLGISLLARDYRIRLQLKADLWRLPIRSYGIMS